MTENMDNFTDDDSPKAGVPTGSGAVEVKPLKAYVWQEEDEGTGGVVFARSGLEARKSGSSQFSDGDFNSGKARRAPWADAYVGLGWVPLEIMLENGWWFECEHCGERITEDREAEDGSEQNPIQAGQRNFCTPDCLHLWGWQKVEEARLKAQTVEDLTAKLLAKVPGVTITDAEPHVYVAFRTGKPVAEQAVISFTWPTCKIGPGHFRFDKAGEEPVITICSGDQDAWNEWRPTPTPKVGTPAQAESPGDEAQKGKP